jgi:hypothetical protein
MYLLSIHTEADHSTGLQETVSLSYRQNGEIAELCNRGREALTFTRAYKKDVARWPVLQRSKVSDAESSITNLFSGNGLFQCSMEGIVSQRTN